MGWRAIENLEVPVPCFENQPTVLTLPSFVPAPALTRRLDTSWKGWCDNVSGAGAIREVDRRLVGGNCLTGHFSWMVMVARTMRRRGARGVRGVRELRRRIFNKVTNWIHAFTVRIPGGLNLRGEPLTSQMIQTQMSRDKATAGWGRSWMWTTSSRFWTCSFEFYEALHADSCSFAFCY